MKALVLALFVACGATAASAVENPAAGAAAAPQDLLDAAKEAKAKRKKSTTRVITNADVKKAKAKLSTTGAPSTPVKPEPSMMEKHEAAKAAKAAADAQHAALEKLIADLEKELAAVEQSYYEENDLDKRDTVIVKRFHDVKKKLDEARGAAGGLKPAATPP